MRVNAVIVAAGEGKRMGGGIAKPLLPLAGRPLILHTLARFAASQIRRVILVVSQKERATFERLVASDPEARRLDCAVQPGGARRQDSVRQGLARLDDDCEVVVMKSDRTNLKVTTPEDLIAAEALLRAEKPC